MNVDQLRKELEIDEGIKHVTAYFWDWSLGLTR